MSDSAHTTRHWVAKLIVLLLLFRCGIWAWTTYSHRQQRQAENVLQSKIAASKLYDNALLRAQTLLNQPDTTAAARLLDSLGRVPTDHLFAIERQKLRQLQLQLDSIRTFRHSRL